ncbi:hypothetical protein SH661x_003612 [Planctomicrobium sp. SH661]|uniref:hypothetical protein n=1 Tax=Planctomicrobium sp. SH661 TaxID=3448124 RepID=UPI003F5ADDE8
MKWSLICSGLILCFTSTVQAQGLIWSLPKDGDWVRYEGTYTQTVKRPDSAQEDLTMEWRRIVTLKSVGTEEAEYKGKEQPCRWLEIKCETGKAAEAVVEAGPGGVRIYKVLVPESAIQGKVLETVKDNRTVHVSFIPIVKGFRKIGDGPVQPIESGVLELYPLVSLVRHSLEVTDSEDAKPEQVPAGTFDVTQHTGETTMETPSERSTNTFELARSSEIPFGVVKWIARSTIENKASTEPRSEFEETSQISENMEAVATGNDAEAEIAEK